MQVDITGVTQEVEPEYPGDANDPRAQLREEETISSSTAADEQESQDPPTHTPPTAESEETPVLMVSPDQQMNLTLRKFFGEGSFAKVVSGDWAEDGRQVAVKVSHKLCITERDSTESGLKNLKNELDILKALRRSRDLHQHGSNFFCELFKSWQDVRNVYFVMVLYPWNLDELRWATPDWDASADDKILLAAEMVCLQFTFVPLSRSRVTAGSRRPGSPPNANLTSRYQAS